MKNNVALLIILVSIFATFTAFSTEIPFNEDDVKIDLTSDSTKTDSSPTVEKSQNGKYPTTGVITVGSRLRLREWPWGKVMNLFAGGTNVQVLGEEGEFYKVKVNGQTGYMHKNYVSIPDAPASRVEPYYPGDTKYGGYIGRDGSPGKMASGSSGPEMSISGAAAEKALNNYKGGKLSPAEFGRLFGPIARDASKRSGVPASIILAQAALETGWGRSSIKDAKNLFGIKGTGPAGTVRVQTKEFVNGRMITISDNFRKYNNWMESIEDHGKLLQKPRYAKAMAQKNNPDRFAEELYKAGYATDPQYPSKLKSIMRSNNFYRFNI